MLIFTKKQYQPEGKSAAPIRPSSALTSAAGNQAVLRLLEVHSTTPTNRFAYNFSRIPVHAPAPVTIQPKLTVSTPGDMHEQQADQVAEQVMSQSESNGKIACSGQIAPTPIPQVLGSTGRPLDASARAFFEPRFGHDFSHVRVHNDAKADTAARALNARAFTIGGDVVFASGEFRTETAAGRRLLAHELSHVIQQSGGSTAGQGSSPLHASAPSIQRDVQTLGGKWDTTKYEKVLKEAGRDVTGLDIALKFIPEDPVDAELIGLTQTVRLVREGKSLFVPESSGRRATPKGEKDVDPGVHIDQPETANPLYATGEAGAGDTLASTPVALPGISTEGEVRERGQHGFHYRDAAGALKHEDAILIDKPLLRLPAKNSSQTFETTALAIKGRQEGTYYGSVKWGWETDKDGTLNKLPLSLGAVGVPSATFMRAAELWNKATSGKGAVPTIDLPTAKLPSSAVMPVRFSTPALVIEIARINRELASMSAGTAKTNKEFEKSAFEFELAKRRDKPTISMADQEKAAAMLTTADLFKRFDALTDEMKKGEPSSGSATNKQVEWDAVIREILKRKLRITVHVHDTQDVFSDNVYVKAPSGYAKWESSVVKINSGEEEAFTAPLSSLFYTPSTPLLIEVYDEDVEGDDLMFTKSWLWSDVPTKETQSRDGGRYTVKIDFVP